jgi:hypothetical protein
MKTFLIQSFLLNNSPLQTEVDRLNDTSSFDRKLVSERIFSDPQIASHLPQFDPSLRKKAAEMAAYYEIFFLLENDIRKLISEALSAQKGDNWWDECVPQIVKETAKKNRAKEIENGITERSSFNIDYINFGELGEIIKTNIDVFGSIIRSTKALEKIISTLNLIRNSIAHCGSLSEHEILRLKIAFRDWYAQVQ